MKSDFVKIGTAVVIIFFFFLGVRLTYDNPQTRPVTETKGVYEGAEDQALDKSTVDALRQRALNYGNSGL